MSGQNSGQNKRKRHTPEQVIIKLREIDADLGAGQSIQEIARKHAVSEATIGRWRQIYGGMKGSDVKRLRELETENSRLKRAVADLTLDNQCLKELSRGNF